MANAVRRDAALSIPALAATGYCSGAQTSEVLYPSSQRQSQVRIKNQEYLPTPVITENLFLSFLHLHLLSYSKVL